MRPHRIALAALTAACAALAGCVVAPAYPARYGYADSYYGEVSGPPPAPRYEAYGAAPYPGWFWIGGHWTWRANRHNWVDGHWQAPRRGSDWRPHRWEPISGGRGWREVPGGWNR